MRTESAVEESGHVLTKAHCKCIRIYFMKVYFWTIYMWLFTLLNILINEKNTVAGCPFDFDVFNRIHSIIIYLDVNIKILVLSAYNDLECGCQLRTYLVMLVHLLNIDLSKHIDITLHKGKHNKRPPYFLGWPGKTSAIEKCRERHILYLWCH